MAAKIEEKAMTSLSIQKQAQLPDLVHGLAFGDEVVIVENDQAVARIVPAAERPRRALDVRAHCGAGPLYGPRF